MKTLLFFPRLIAIFLVTYLSPIPSSAQLIHLHSISDRREPGGYTLDGYFMRTSRSKLLFGKNFGSSGLYPKSIVITDGYTHVGDLTTISSIPNIDLFFFGAFNIMDMDASSVFSKAEIDSFYSWSLRGGKLIIGSSAPFFGYNPAVLNQRWGYHVTTNVPSFVIPTEAGKRTKIFDGPFGKLSSAGQGGDAQGYFSTVPPTAVVLATTLNGEPTMLFDCATKDIIVADIDMFTSLGGITTSLDIENNQDRIWANTIAFMDNMEAELAPALIQNGNTFSTDLKYDQYEWYYQLSPYKDMFMGSDADFVPPKSGTYLLKAKGADKIGCYSEFNKTFVFEKPETIKESDPDVEIMPNPAVEGELKLVYQLPNTTEYVTDFKVTDMAGRLIYSSKEKMVKRRANTLIVDVSTWAAAIYNIEVTLAGRSFVRRFIKI